MDTSSEKFSRRDSCSPEFGVGDFPFPSTCGTFSGNAGD